MWLLGFLKRNQNAFALASRYWMENNCFQINRSGRVWKELEIIGRKQIQVVVREWKKLVESRILIEYDRTMCEFVMSKNQHKCLHGGVVFFFTVKRSNCAPTQWNNTQFIHFGLPFARFYYIRHNWNVFEESHTCSTLVNEQQQNDFALFIQIKPFTRWLWTFCFSFLKL